MQELTIESFNDNELKDIYEKNKSVLEDNIELLNKLSSDIRLMDSILSGKGLIKSTYVSLHIGNGEAKLMWSGKFVMYVERNFTLDSRKLIECPKEIRLKCKPYLPEFFKMCLNAIAGV